MWICAEAWKAVLTVLGVAEAAQGSSSPEPWTWGDAVAIAVFGLLIVFAILGLLNFLTTVAGKLIAKYERHARSNSSAGSE